MSARRLLFAIASAASLAAATGAHAVDAHILPADPEAGEAFLVRGSYCRGGSPTWFLGATSRVEGSRIRVDAQFGGSDFSVPSCATMNAVASAPSAGTYAVSFSIAADSRYTDVALGDVRVTPASPPTQPALRGLSGNWFDVSKPGWGVNIIQGGSGALFAIWAAYQYDFLGGVTKPAYWFVMPNGRWRTPTTFRGLFYSTSQSVSINQSTGLRNSAISVIPAGVGTFTFADDGHVDFHGELAPDGASSSETRKVLQRLRF
jgi:hypothetical protein